MSKEMDKNLFNEEGLRDYPISIKALPFCCWRMETVNGRKTKVPYEKSEGSPES